MIAIANLLVGVLTMVAGQAPGDEQELCTVTLPALIKPEHCGGPSKWEDSNGLQSL